MEIQHTPADIDAATEALSPSIDDTVPQLIRTARIIARVRQEGRDEALATLAAAEAPAPEGVDTAGGADTTA